jgi:hypothetical protein
MVLTGGIAGVQIPGQDLQNRRAAGVSFRFVTPGLLPAFGVPVLEGREVAESDEADAPLVVVVSQSFVERYWPGHDPAWEDPPGAQRPSAQWSGCP